jgi:hypothetical protein
MTFAELLVDPPTTESSAAVWAAFAADMEALGLEPSEVTAFLKRDQRRYPKGDPRGGQFASSGSAPPITRAQATGAPPFPKFTLAKTATRAFTGEQVLTRKTLTKDETGKLGEALLGAYLGEKARSLNIGRNNFPIDIRHGDKLIEAKSGLVSNAKDSQKWRATIGEPGRAEKAWMQSLSPEDKRKWNDHKKAQIMRRKYDAVKKVSYVLGRAFKPTTMMTIINPDARTVDIFEMQGFHREIRWNSREMAASYKGTYRYTKG